MKTAITAILILIIMMTGCAQQSDTVKIGWVGPLSGDAASFGTPNLHGVELAVESINAKGGIDGMPIELIIEDDGLESKQSRNAFQKLINVNNVEAVLMATYGGILTSGPLADQEQIPLINSVDTSNELGTLGPYTFGIGIYDEGIGYRLAEYLYNSKQYKTAAVLYNTEDPVLELFKDAFVERFEELGGSVVVEEGYTSSTSDFRSTLTKVKNSEVDTLGVVSYDEGGLVFKQARELGIDVQLFGIDTVTSKGFLDNAGDAAEGMYFTFWGGDAPEVVAVSDRYKQKYGNDPENILFTAVGYDATNALAFSMQGNKRGAELQKQLLSLNYFKGITGDLTMDKDGMVRSVSEEIFQYKEKELVLIER